MFPCLFFSTFSIFSSLFQSFPPPLFLSIPLLYILSFFVAPPFLFPALFFLLISSLCFPRLFSPLALSLSQSPTYGRKAAQAQGNGINFHSRLNSQSISLELNTLPPIRKSQGSISPFPRRHSPAIQRQPRQPCLTFWRCKGGGERLDWSASMLFISTGGTKDMTNKHESLRTTQLASFECDAH